MKIYLDHCVFNRPFDDQNHIHVRLESIAKLHIQQRIKEGKFFLVWSYILDIENEQNPFYDRKLAIEKWRTYAIGDIEETEPLLDYAIELTKIGLKSKDALHVASAIIANVDYFLTTDTKILKKLSNHPLIKVVNPINFIQEFEKYAD